ncbi:hypothetical protein ACHAWO_006512 [Cyclotella atomus]|uniref:Uncharacterized protein n=1 Tax=Cyclotella atomus TaxID=382360 RepID=A0ABD3Q202_9STRA
MVALPGIAISLAAASRPATAFLSPSINKRFHRTICQSSTTGSQNGPWTEVAINAAKQFTITQRQKLNELGLLDILRPIKIL